MTGNEAQSHYHAAVIDWAYESTPNTLIVAGAVPEPATWVLCIVTAVVVAGWKLRRLASILIVALLLVPAVASGQIAYRLPSPNPSDSVSDLNGDDRRDFEIGKLANFPLPGQPDFFQFHVANVRDGITGTRPSNSVLLRDQSLVPLVRDTIIGPSPTPDHDWEADFISRSISFNSGEGWTGP